MIKALLYWEVDPEAIAEVGEASFEQIADVMAQNEAAARRVEIADRQKTVSDDGRKVIYVWNLKDRT